MRCKGFHEGVPRRMSTSMPEIVSRHFVPVLRLWSIVVLLGPVAIAADAPAMDAKAHWSFVAPHPVNASAGDGSSSIDALLLKAMEREGLSPSPQADRPTQVRRVHLDLTGLPPTPSEVADFVKDQHPDSYDRLVDRLLSSPHFGEKWARWWLDLAGYADSDGYLSDFLRPYAWRYRQWVVDALNDDMPFDQFTVEQLAGDLLPAATVSQRMATGFLRNTLNNREGGADLEEFRVERVIARTNTVGTVWLGLTVGCAECHDHKFDPISQKEYFQLYAFLNDADEVNINAPIGDDWERYESAKKGYDEKRRAILAPAADDIASLQVKWEAKLLAADARPGETGHQWDRAWEVLGLIWGQNFGEGQLEGTLIVKTPVEERTQDQHDRLLDYFLQHGSIIDEAKFAELNLAEISKELDALAASLPNISRAPTIMQNRQGRITHIHTRGDFRAPGERVEPSTPAVLPPMNANGRPSRLDLAMWIVDKRNPLTARVLVNRVWHELFGRGLVITSEDFGTRGARPSHPDLLDQLAIEFIENGWSMKQLIRTIVTSSTYRQSSDERPDLAERDPDNTILARQSRVRLSAELIRDSALAVSGLLSPAIGGPSVRPPQPDSVTKEGFSNTWVASEGPDRYRRGLYTFIQRTSPYGPFINFDLPDPSRSCTRRERSNTPLQALNLLNDPVFVEAAQALARRIEAYAMRRMREHGSVTTDECIDYAFRACLARSPKAEELVRLREYLDEQTAIFETEPGTALALVTERQTSEDSVEPAAWIALSSVLLNLDEFITRE